MSAVPTSDLKTYKKRPALVVQSDDLTTEFHQRIVVQITSNLDRKGETRILVPSNSLQGRSMGLRMDSVIVVDNLVTVMERELDRRLGNCPNMQPVEEALRKTLGL